MPKPMGCFRGVKNLTTLPIHGGHPSQQQFGMGLETVDFQRKSKRLCFFRVVRVRLGVSVWITCMGAFNQSRQPTVIRIKTAFLPDWVLFPSRCDAGFVAVVDFEAGFWIGVGDEQAGVGQDVDLREAAATTAVERQFEMRKVRGLCFVAR